MRILQVTSVYYPELKFGGPPQKIHDLSCGFMEHGHDVQVITLHSEDRHKSFTRMVDGVRVQYLPWIGRGSLRIIGGFGKLRKAVIWADIVHCYGLYNLICPITAYMARQAGRPYLVEPLGMYLPRIRNLRAKMLYHQLFTHAMVRNAASVIATSEAEAQELSGLVAPDRLIIRRNGIDLKQFQNLSDGGSFRQRYGIGTDETIILYIGRISPVKNLEELVVAFRDAALPNARLILVGPMLEAQYATRLNALVAAHGLSDKVMFTGPLYNDDKLTALAAANLFVLPSISESYGNAAAEAVAAGIPVLLTEGCGIAPAIHRRAGLAVPNGIESLTNGLQTLIGDKVLCAEYTRQRESVLKELSWDEPLTQTESIYAGLLSASEASPSN